MADHRRLGGEFLDRQKMEALGGLIGGIAHDCNNLLSGILAHAELAIAESAAGVSPEEVIGRIKGLALRASEIVRELMICAGQEGACTEPLDISGLIAEMVQLLRVLVPKSVAIQTKLGKRLPAVMGSAPRIRQVVMNLMINASEAIGDTEGAIAVSTRRVSTRYDSVLAGGASLPAGDYVVLEVSDTGRGMSEQTQARAFGPFFTTKPTGRGLGLSVVREIVREHGGVIGVESAPSRGSAFYVFLPCQGKPARRARPVPRSISLEEAAGAGICVLIVEDEDALRLVVSRMLRKHGFTVLEARDGYGAVEFFRERSDAIDVVLLDWAIAGASSCQVSEQARRLRLPAKIILTSAYSREMALAGLDWRPAGFIRKPYQIPDLVRTLHAAVTL